jgi:hypothetical protein
LYITLLLFILYTIRQYQLQSAYFIKSRSNSLKTNTNITRQTSTQIPLTKLLVISHFNEDLDWLDLFIGDKIPHIVYTRSSDPLARHNIVINKGREAVAYLRYIVDHYSSLPSLIAFIHAHRTSWHQKDPPDIVVALRALKWNKYPYMPLTSVKAKAFFKLNTPDPQTAVNYELWRDVLQKELGSPPVNGIRTHCCASFVVKREAILTHPKVFYSKIIDYILASRHSDQLTGRTLEYDLWSTSTY